MKKLLLSAAVALFAFSANAQIVTSRSESVTRIESPKTPSNNYWFLRAGLGFIGSSEIEDSKSKMGYEFELGHAWMLGSEGAHLDLALGFASRGFKSEEDDYKESLTAHQVYLAPTFGWKFKVADNIAIDPHVGAFFGYDMGGKLKQEDEYDSEDYDLGDIDDYNRFDAGMKFGAGVWFGKFNVDFAYKTSFTKLVDTDEDAPKTHSFEISVAYAF